MLLHATINTRRLKSSEKECCEGKCTEDRKNDLSLAYYLCRTGGKNVCCHDRIMAAKWHFRQTRSFSFLCEDVKICQGDLVFEYTKKLYLQVFLFAISQVNLCKRFRGFLCKSMITHDLCFVMGGNFVHWRDQNLWPSIFRVDVLTNRATSVAFTPSFCCSCCKSFALCILQWTWWALKTNIQKHNIYFFICLFVYSSIFYLFIYSFIHAQYCTLLPYRLLAFLLSLNDAICNLQVVVSAGFSEFELFTIVLCAFWVVDDEIGYYLPILHAFMTDLTSS